jgi:acetyl-CoA synthetase
MQEPGPAREAIWVPDDAHVKRSRLLAALKRWGYADVEEMHRASIEDPETFWRAVVEDLDVTFATPFRPDRGQGSCHLRG